MLPKASPAATDTLASETSPTQPQPTITPVASTATFAPEAWKDMPVVPTVSDTARQIYQGKTVLAKSPQEKINASQRKRAWMFYKTGGKHAKTVEEATKKAQAIFNLELDKLEITVISEGRGGILGLGASDAKISVKVRGEPRVFDVTCEPLRDNTGAVTGLSSAWVDLTQQRSLEARRTSPDNSSRTPSPPAYRQCSRSWIRPTCSRGSRG